MRIIKVALSEFIGSRNNTRIFGGPTIRGIFFTIRLSRLRLADDGKNDSRGPNRYRNQET